MNKSIAILGCGWLGFPLAKNLLKKGCQIHGSTTTESKLQLLSNTGITPFLLQFNTDEIIGDIATFLKDVSVLIINIPPRLKKSNEANYVAKITLLMKEVEASQLKNIIFISSTAVYGNIAGEVDENTHPIPVTLSGQQLLKAEQLIATNPNLNYSIIRFGGLIGENRHPITTLSGKKELKNGHYPINLIHLNDCIAIIESIIEKEWWNTIFNGVYPYHPTKKEYYTKCAIEKNLPIPEYLSNSSQEGKIILSKSLIESKKYLFSHSI